MKVCEVCQTPLVAKTRHGAPMRFCSRACFTSVIRSVMNGNGDHRLPHESYTPDQWDGQTRYNDAHRGLRPYQVVCLQAGHVMKRDVRLTEFQAARIVILGFKTRCGDCGGWLMLESDEDGQIGGGVQAHTVTGGYWWPESAA